MKTSSIITIILLLIASTHLFGQRGLGDHYIEKSEKLKAEKIKFFNEELELKEDEAEKFWDVYNDFYNRRSKIYDSRRNMIRYLSENADNLEEKEIEENIDKITETFQEEAILMEKYYDKFKSVLPIQKVVKIYQAEHKFKRYLMHKLKGHRGGGGGHGKNKF